MGDVVHNTFLLNGMVLRASCTLAFRTDVHLMMHCNEQPSLPTPLFPDYLLWHIACVQTLVSGSTSGAAQTQVNLFSSSLEQPLKLFITLDHVCRWDQVQYNSLSWAVFGKQQSGFVSQTHRTMWPLMAFSCGSCSLPCCANAKASPSPKPSVCVCVCWRNTTFSHFLKTKQNKTSKRSLPWEEHILNL